MTNPPEYHVDLENYRGPMDLLLYLVDRSEVDVRDVSLKDITEQYLHYVKMVREVRLAEAGEFLVLASHLMELKSRSLLPRILIETEREE